MGQRCRVCHVLAPNPTGIRHYPDVCLRCEPIALIEENNVLRDRLNEAEAEVKRLSALLSFSGIVH